MVLLSFYVKNQKTSIRSVGYFYNFFFFKYNHLDISSGVQLSWDCVFLVVMLLVTLKQNDEAQLVYSQSWVAFTIDSRIFSSI